MNAKKPNNNDAEILHRINRFTSDADWSADELRTELINEGIDPDELISSVKKMISTYISDADKANSLAGKVIEESDQKRFSFKGILATAKEMGMNNFQLADLTGLSIVLIAQFDRGLIKANTKLPVEIIKRIASAINVTTEQISDSLKFGPRFAAGASYKSEEPPKLTEAQDFPDAVRLDPTLSAERRESLLSLVKIVD